MEYVSIAGIFREIVSEVSASLLPQLQLQNELTTGVHFEHGHYLEIANLLQMKAEAGSPIIFDQWPLVGLFRDFPETRALGKYAEISVTLIIANATDPNYTPDQREAINFIPVLYPIYQALLEAIDNDVRFDTTSAEEIEHTKIDHYYWGSKVSVDDKRPNVFNQWTDSIELRDLKLIVNPKNC